MQTKLTGLSRRGQGMNQDEEMDDVLSNLRGRFIVENAAARFSSLTFSVPGAAVELAGRYGLRDELIDFRGKLKMQATLSQVAGGGVKGFFLKAFDPFFKKARCGHGAAHQDHGHAEGAEVRIRYVLVRHRVHQHVDRDRVPSGEKR